MRNNEILSQAEIDQLLTAISASSSNSHYFQNNNDFSEFINGKKSVKEECWKKYCYKAAGIELESAQTKKTEIKNAQNKMEDKPFYRSNIIKQQKSDDFDIDFETDDDDFFLSDFVPLDVFDDEIVDGELKSKNEWEEFYGNVETPQELQKKWAIAKARAECCTEILKKEIQKIEPNVNVSILDEAQRMHRGNYESRLELESECGKIEFRASRPLKEGERDKIEIFKSSESFISCTIPLNFEEVEKNARFILDIFSSLPKIKEESEKEASKKIKEAEICDMAIRALISETDEKKWILETFVQGFSNLTLSEETEWKSVIETQIKIEHETIDAQEIFEKINIRKEHLKKSIEKATFLHSLFENLQKEGKHRSFSFSAYENRVKVRIFSEQNSVDIEIFFDSTPSIFQKKEEIEKNLRFDWKRLDDFSEKDAKIKQFLEEHKKEKNWLWNLKTTKDENRVLTLFLPLSVANPRKEVVLTIQKSETENLSALQNRILLEWSRLS